MSYARCPACQTVFRISATQLAAHCGEVRCGHCFNPFNAHQHELVDAGTGDDEPPAEMVPAPQHSTSPRNQPADPVAEVAPQRHETVDRQHVPTAISGPSPAPADAARAMHADEPGVWRSGRGRHEPAIRVEPHEPLVLPTPDSPGAPTIAEHIDRAADDDFSALLERARVAAEALPESHQPADEPVPVEGLPPAAERRDRDSAGAAEPTDVPAQPDGDRREGPGDFDRRYAPQATTRTWPWLLGSLLLGMTALLQGAYLFRVDLGKSIPAARPVLVAACERIGCDMPLPRETASMVLIDSNLTPLPRPEQFLLEAVVENRAGFAQAWPYLELTLTDAIGRAILRRVLTPTEWAAIDTPKERAGMPPQDRQTLRLPLAVDGANPQNYTLRLFFP